MNTNDLLPNFLILGFWGKIEMKGQKENIQDKKGKLGRSNTHPNSPKLEASQRISPK